MTEEENISSIGEDEGSGKPALVDKTGLVPRKFFLKGESIGISISESDNLDELGYGVSHLRDAMIEIARYILALGGRLTYGGDMRQGGFTELIFDLLAYYKADNELHPNQRFFSYLAYPISANLSAAKEAGLIQNVSFKKVAPPDDLEIKDVGAFLKPDSVENLYVWTRCLTKMREEMEAACNARIFIGGKTKGFKGRCPGVLEELLIAIEHNHPIYLAGAFGGITKESISALNGESPACFENEYYMDNPNYNGMFKMYNEKHASTPIDYPKYLKLLQDYGMNAVANNNGLSEEDNHRLCETPHISEIVYLIMKGLAKRFA